MKRSFIIFLSNNHHYCKEEEAEVNIIVDVVE